MNTNIKICVCCPRLYDGVLVLMMSMMQTHTYTRSSRCTHAVFNGGLSFLFAARPFQYVYLCVSEFVVSVADKQTKSVVPERRRRRRRRRHRNTAPHETGSVSFTRGLPVCVCVCVCCTLCFTADLRTQIAQHTSYTSAGAVGPFMHLWNQSLSVVQITITTARSAFEAMPDHFQHIARSATNQTNSFEAR